MCIITKMKTVAGTDIRGRVWFLVPLAILIGLLIQ